MGKLAMETLILNSLEIRKFGGFQHLPMERLGRVNLIVGKNNVGKSKPLPLQNLGNGIWRNLGIALALVNAKDGILLIDEFEHGLYYSVQPDLWGFIFRLARSLNVQVFATTHSWDCIEAFQRAASEDHQEEGLLIRLESKKGEIGVTLYDERVLTIATREHIEVR
jgi:AAA15 family ATPase/GTPase